MKNSKLLEFSVGILILLGILAFMFMALKVSGLSMTNNPFFDDTYTLNADFTDIGSLKVRAPVRIAGVQIGTVTHIKLDPSNYEAHVEMGIQKGLEIPEDSSASITSSGILGDNYVSVVPGYSSTNMQNGAQFITTYAATSFSSLISTFMGSGNTNNNHGGKK